MENSKEIEDVYAEAAQAGSSEAPSAQDEVDHHYICLVKSSGDLYELDGDLGGPINRGHLTEDEDVIARPGLDVIRKYINSEREGKFCLLALVQD